MTNTIEKLIVVLEEAKFATKNLTDFDVVSVTFHLTNALSIMERNSKIFAPQNTDVETKEEAEYIQQMSDRLGGGSY